MKYQATTEALQRVSPDVLLLAKARWGAFYRWHIGEALAREGMLQLVEVRR